MFIRLFVVVGLALSVMVANPSQAKREKLSPKLNAVYLRLVQIGKSMRNLKTVDGDRLKRLQAQMLALPQLTKQEFFKLFTQTYLRVLEEERKIKDDALRHARMTGIVYATELYLLRFYELEKGFLYSKRGYSPILRKAGMPPSHPWKLNSLGKAYALEPFQYDHFMPSMLILEYSAMVEYGTAPPRQVHR